MSTQTSRISLQWVISPPMDLAWFIGGALAAYGLFFLHAGLGWDMVGVWFLWVVLLDSPHFFGTISRTYLDRQESKERRKLLTWSLLLFLVGPLAVGLSGVLYLAGMVSYQLPWQAFLIFFGLWAYWHIVRQHYGFLRLYHKKNGEAHGFDARLDSALLYGSLLLSFVVFIIRHPDVREQLGLTRAWPGWGGGEGLAWEAVVVLASAGIIGGLALAFLVRQAIRWYRHEPINGPKILFLLAVVPLHVYVCFSSAVLTASLLAFSAFITIFHDIQYHAIIWFHHRNRYHRPGVDPAQFGWAPKVSRNLATYFGCAIFFALLFRLLGCTFDLHPGCTPFLISSEYQLFGAIHADALLKGLLLGFPLHHYYLDQHIWKTRSSQTLRENLRLDEVVD